MTDLSDQGTLLHGGPTQPLASAVWETSDGKGINDMKRFLSLSGSRFSRPDFGGRRTEHLLIGGLIVVIVGALALAIFGGGGDDTEEYEPMWQCQAEGCKHEFRPPPVKTPPVKDRPDVLMDDMQMVILDCPKCGAKEGCLPMDRCVKCGESYVSGPTTEWAAKQKADPDATPMGRVKSRNICPHCNTDQIQWRRKQRGKGGKK